MPEGDRCPHRWPGHDRAERCSQHCGSGVQCLWGPGLQTHRQCESLAPKSLRSNTPYTPSQMESAHWKIDWLVKSRLDWNLVAVWMTLIPSCFCQFVLIAAKKKNTLVCCSSLRKNWACWKSGWNARRRRRRRLQPNQPSGREHRESTPPTPTPPSCASPPRRRCPTSSSMSPKHKEVYFSAYEPRSSPFQKLVFAMFVAEAILIHWALDP